MRYESMTNKQLRALLIEAEELNDDQAHRLGKLEHGIQKYLDGDEPEYKPNVDCVHGTPHYKDCFECLDDYFAELLHGARLMDSDTKVASSNE